LPLEAIPHRLCRPPAAAAALGDDRVVGVGAEERAAGRVVDDECGDREHGVQSASASL
jgi:hypothetical protein